MYNQVDKKSLIEGLINTYEIFIEGLDIDSVFNVYVLDDETFSELKYILNTLLKNGVYYIQNELIVSDVFDRFSTLPYKFPGARELFTVNRSYLLELYKVQNKEDEMKKQFKKKMGIDLDDFKKYLNK